MAADSFPVIYSPLHKGHNPVKHPDIPARADALIGAALDFGLISRPPADFGLAPIIDVHSPDMLTLLQSAYQRFAQLPQGPRPAIPDSFAVRELAGYVPRSIWGQLGHYCSDDLTPILETTWEAAYWSAQAALSGAHMLRDGISMVYALCRPPGHHAYRDMYGGYCYLNNSAIAGEYLVRQRIRPAIIDIDYHHGNGTQAIFYDRADVYFSSIHADPDDEYPYYCGFAHEIGREAGEGFTLNVPLPLGTGEVDYLRALERVLVNVEEFRPDVLILSLGFDTLAGDPQGGMNLESGSFRLIGRLLAGTRRPLLIVQEGGYLIPNLAPALMRFLEGLTS